jgi:predicted ABC-type ATPase
VKNTLDRKILSSLVETGAIPSLDLKIASKIRWQAVFFIGPAGSGKSFYKTKKHLKHIDFKEVDPDEIKKRHPDYNPERPFELHSWSKLRAEGEYKKIVTDGSGTPVIVDGTGRNWESVYSKIQMAKSNGYKTHLIYVYVPLEISIWRNRNRERFVPEDVILEQSDKIGNSFKMLKSRVDKYKVVQHYSSPEVSVAKKDIAVYPVPQKVRPPRPGDANYGIKENQMQLAASLIRIAKELLG